MPVETRVNSVMYIFVRRRGGGGERWGGENSRMDDARKVACDRTFTGMARPRGAEEKYIGDTIAFLFLPPAFSFIFPPFLFCGNTEIPRFSREANGRRGSFLTRTQNRPRKGLILSPSFLTNSSFSSKFVATNFSGFLGVRARSIRQATRYQLLKRHNNVSIMTSVRRLFDY